MRDVTEKICCSKMSRVRTAVRKHPAASVAAALFTVAGVVMLVGMMPDIVRIVRMRRM